jgi:Ca-activated chloride channel family protein
MKRTSFLVVPVFVGAFLMIATLLAQTPSDPTLVYLRATAIESKGRPVTGLRQTEFKIFEDNVPQDIAYFSDADASLSVALLIDADAGVKDRVKQTALGELKNRAPAAEEFYVVDSNDAPLNTVVYAALNELLERRSDKLALILFTTRSNPASSSFSKVKEFLKNNDVRLYVIALSMQNSAVDDTAKDVLRELAETSGGNAFFPPSVIAISNIYRSIGADLRNQYLVGYHPTNRATDGKWRKIKVSAQHIDLRGKKFEYAVRTRTGYYAPSTSRQ